MGFDLPDGWDPVKLGEVCSFQKGFAFKSSDYQTFGRRIIKVSNLDDYYVNLNNCVYIDEKKAKTYMQYELNVHDVIITTVGSWLTNPNSVVGKVAKMQYGLNGPLLNQNAVRVKGEHISQVFLFYVLKNISFLKYIVGKAQGSANQASITQNDIKNYSFSLPPLPEQHAIAATLSCFDNKIELNNHMNKTLEEMAQTIFKRWFVDFEFPNEDGQPYKSSGGAMLDSELGEIPQGWRVGTFAEFIDSTISGDWGKETQEGKYTEKVVCIRGADISQIEQGKKGNAPTRYIFKKSLDNKQLNENEIFRIFSCLY